MKSFCFWGLIAGAALVLGQSGWGEVLFDSREAVQAKPPLRIYGRVLDASGTPAAGVVLTLLPIGSAGITSDGDGKYSLDWRPTAANAALNARVYTLVAREFGRNLAAAHAIDETTTNLDLQLEPGLTISAQVVEPNGKPVANAAGSLLMYSGNSAVTLTRPPVPADDQGQLEFKALPRGFRYRAMIRAAGHGSSSILSVREEDSETNRLELPAVVLPVANLQLGGKVVGVNGKPVAGARVGVLGTGQPTTNTLTDDEGHFTLNVCDGPVTVSATLQNAEDNSVRTTLQGRENVVGGETNVEIKLMPPNQRIVQPVPQIRLADPLPLGMVAPCPEEKEMTTDCTDYTDGVIGRNRMEIQSALKTKSRLVARASEGGATHSAGLSPCLLEDVL